MEVLRSSLRFLERRALVAQDKTFTYQDILNAAVKASKALEPIPARVPSVAFPQNAATQPRVALMADPGLAYISGTLGTWLNRSISVPLCLTHPDRELSYVLEDSGSSAVLTTKPYLDRMRRLAEPFGAQVIEIEEENPHNSTSNLEENNNTKVENQASTLLSTLQPDDGALIIYTSGTTGRPKGAVHTHKSLDAQINAINSAWEISSSDNILHALPLHHVHGIVNALYCPLAAGGTVTMLPKFSPAEVWNHFDTANISVFMGVPTMYSFLLNFYHNAPEAEQNHYKAAIQNSRLAISGSSACPTPIMHAWSELSGESLLERYGMTETGMILGNPLHGERKAGTVGVPFPGIQVRIDPATGELAVRGDQLFAGYWQKPDATEKSFDSDGYFLTGDTAEEEEQGALGGYYRLLGRTSVDIIKHGGFKISALEIESVLLGHPRIAECAVVGVPDQHYGEIIAVIAALKKTVEIVDDGEGKENKLTLDQLLEYARDHLAPYQLPRILHLVPQLPRNAMGKVNKKTLRAEVFPDLFPHAGPSSSLPSPAA